MRVIIRIVTLINDRPAKYNHKWN